MRFASLTTIVLLTGSFALAEPTPRDELLAASRALAGTGNYTWVTTVGSEGGPTGGGAGGAKLRVGPTDGRTADGVTHVLLKRGDLTFEAAFKHDRHIISTNTGWRPIAEVAARGGVARKGNPTIVIARSLRGFKAPPLHAKKLLRQTTELTKTEGTFTGELTEDGAKSLLPLGAARRGPTVTDASGKVTFWTKDGLLVKYEYTVHGTVEINGKRRSVDQTSTTTITDIGSTRLDLAPEAKLKLQ